MRRARLGFLQTRIEVAKGRLLPLGAPYHTDRPEQLVMLAAVRQVLEIAFQLEPYARAAAHAPPAIKKYARNHQKANNDQPFTQTKIHEYRVPVCYALARVRQYHGCMALCTGRFYTSASAAASSTLTVTSREHPGSCMVTPISWSAISMAILLWVI